MTEPGTPRFRIRDPAGGERPVGSVEELSERIARGEIDADTPLFDSGTGAWGRAGDLPVYRFIVEELAAESKRATPPGVVDGPEVEEGGLEPDVEPASEPPEPVDPGTGFAPIEHLEHPDPRTPRPPPTPDPFELHLPLENPLAPDDGNERFPGARSPWDSGDASPADVSGGEPPEEGADAPPDPPPEPPPAVPGGGGRAAAAGPDAPGTDEPGEEELEPWFEDRPFVPGARREEAEPAAKQGDEEAGEPDPEDLPVSERPDWITHGPPPPSSRPAPAPPELEAAEEDAVGSPFDPEEFDRGDPFGPEFDGRPGAGRAPARATPEDDAGGEGAGNLEALEIRTAWEDEATPDDPRKARLVARRRQRNVRILGGAAVLVLGVLGVAAIVVSVRSPGVPEPAPTLPALPPAQLPGTGTADLPPAPPGHAYPGGLEAEGRALWEALPGQVTFVVDSLRAEAGLEGAPPAEWLGGYYLANAGEFPGVPAFWTAYEAFVESLAGRDAELFRGAAGRALDELGIEGPDRARLLAFVEGMRAEVAERREDRYRHLVQTATEARALHDFLVANSGAIRHAPALGQGVSRDPVLEAVTETPELRREMERHLDRVFQALDRSRGGGQPSMAGLRAELFGNFARPL